MTNPFQGKAKRVLCVCSAGLLRSPTMANVLHQKYGYNTRSAGVTIDFALIPVDEVLLMWADEIVCAEMDHAMRVSAMASHYEIALPEVISLGIPDLYSFGDKDLIALIIAKYEKAKGVINGTVHN